MSSKSYNLQSQINLSRDRRRTKLLIRRLSGENQPKEFTWKRTSRLTWSSRFRAESISANFTVLTESMTNSFQKLGENLNVMNDNIMSLVHWPGGELSEDILEQIDVNEVSEGSEKHPNDGKNADELATSLAEPPCKREKS